MNRYYGKFDAKAYWENKPLCSVCKKHKVKNGSVCYECKNLINKRNKQSNSINSKNDMDNIIDEPIIDINTEIPKKKSQIKFDVNFINKILEKLKVGDSRSIHLNAVPGRSALRLDLCDLVFNESDLQKSFALDSQEDNIPLNFIKTILNKESFSFNISYDKLNIGSMSETEKKTLSLISKRLNSIVAENIDNYLEFGIKNFGFGYPLLIKRSKNDPSKIIKAPLFIWHLDIERSYQNKNTWIIKKDEDSPIKVNEILISYLSKDESIKIEKISKDLLDDGLLNEEEFIKLTKDTLLQLGSSNEDIKIRIEKCLESKDIENIANSKPWIQWSGIFGIYRSQNETIIHATEEILKNIDELNKEDLILEPFQTSTVSAVDTDPSKEEIINTLIRDEVKLIQGPPGTGKSQSITAIISNALANNAKCLIVCEKKTALDVIQANLVKAGLDDFSVVIDDIDKDRRKVIEKARNINDSHGTYYASKLEFDAMYKLFCRLKEDINSKHSEALKKVFGDFSWKTLIGLYLKFSKNYDLDKLMANVNHSDFIFDYDEYARYLSIIEESSFLFSDLKENSEDFFSIFDKELFLLDFKLNLQETIIKDTNNLFEKVCKVKNDLSDLKDDDCRECNVSIFNPDSIKNSIPLIESSMENLKKISDLYDNGIKLIGDEFNNKTLLKEVKLHSLGLFNSKYKDSYKFRHEIIVILKTFIKDIPLLKKYLSVEFSSEENKFVSFEEINNFVHNFLKEINKSYLKIKKIEKLEKELKTDDLNLSAIFSEKNIFNIKYKKYTDFKDFDSLNNYYSLLLEKVEKTKNNFSSYENYHRWKHYCSDNKTKNELDIIFALKTVPTRDWKDVFMAWYYKNALLNFDSKTTIGFNKSDSKLKELSVVYNNLKVKQVQQIRSIWNTKRREKLHSYSGNFNTFYNLRKNNSGPKNSLRKIIERDFELFTSLFPVILTNPSAANAILPLKQGLFNIIIFDEASQLRIADTFACLIRGQFKIIAGDEHQMPPSNYFLSSSNTFEDTDELEDYDNEQDELAESESLLQYASNLKNINKSTLDFHYRSNHPALIEFSNAAFYGGNLISFPALTEYTPIKFIPVNGRYESNTNPTEVAEIIRIIKDEIQPNENNKYPSVGIATFNINQRNLIIESLNRAAESDPEFLIKYLALRDRGLFIKNLENIQGDEKDIIIISTTYGYGVDGKFSQNFARINRIEGYKLLNVLITRAKNKVYVCTSIPKEKYVSYSELIKGEGGNNKRGILYAYLAYAEAVSNKDKDLAESILSELRLQSFEKPKLIFDDDGLSESPFEEEVYQLLLDHFKKDDVIQQHKVGGFRLDFVIKNNSQDYVLECDGKQYHQSEEAYAYDMYRQKELEHMGFIIYRIWSTNWFQNKELEMSKLLDFVNQPK